MKKKVLIFSLILLVLVPSAIALFRFLNPPVYGGWIEEEGVTYYQDTEGNLVAGWQNIDGKQYYFAEDHTVTTGWLTLDGKRHYFHADGTLAEGWQEIDGKRYYFTGSGAVTGWQGIGGGRFYFHADNTLATGLTVIDGKQHLFSDDGTPTEGIIQLEGKDYLFTDKGILTSGWVDYQEQRYFVNEDGSLYTGWLEQEEKRYYFHTDGTMAIGKTVIDDVTWYFSPHGVQVTLVNPWNYMHADYQVNQVAIDDTYTVDAQCYDALLQMLAACEAAGYKPIICSAYRTQAAQEWLYQRKVNFYLDEGLEEEEARKQAGRSVAIPGTSEHQLGLAVDIVSSDYYVLDETQATTKTQKWLMEHCWEYGFILRYPDDKSEITGIIYEPWHYRYVGVEIAMELRDLGVTLEEYLGAA